MKNIFKLFALVLLISTLSFTSLFAEESPVQTIVQTENVNIYEAQIISQDENQVNISFDIANGEGAQAGVRYGVKLIKETEKGQFIADEHVFDENFSLAVNKTIKKDIIYTAPASLNGEYTLLLELKNGSGLGLGIAVLGKINLASSVDSINILPETCSLSVLSEEGNPKYSLLQGVDISSEETLILTCTVLNSSKEDITITPVYETYFRNVSSGKIVDQVGGDSTPISIKSLEEKSVLLELPRTTTPQAYDIKVSFDSGDIKSNPVIVHYVLSGTSATIKNLILDKDYYNKDDIANITLVWRPSADNFPESRVGDDGTKLSNITIVASIKDDKNRQCIDPLEQVVSEGSTDYNLNLTTSIKRDCKDPKVSVIIKDSDGNILDQRDLSFSSAMPEGSDKSSRGNTTIFIILGILVVAGVAIYIINSKKSNEEKENNQ